MTSYFQSRLKIERAKVHIEEIKRRVANLTATSVVALETNPVHGNSVIKHDVTDKKFASDMALMAGDVMHNLKSALDYAWITTLKRLAPSAISKRPKFPIYETREDLVGALKGLKLETCSPNLFKTVVDVIKSYESGNDSLWTVHQLSIADKHQLLLPVIHYANISDIETVHAGTGELRSKGFTMGTIQSPPWFIPMPLELEVTKTGKLHVAALFGEGVPTTHMDVDMMMEVFAFEVARVVDILENVY